MGKEKSGRPRKISSSSGTPNLSPFKYIPIAYVKKIVLSELGCLVFIFAVITVLLVFAANMSTTKNESPNEAQWDMYVPKEGQIVQGYYQPGQDRVPDDAVPMFPGNQPLQQNPEQNNVQDSWIQPVAPPNYMMQQQNGMAMQQQVQPNPAYQMNQPQQLPPDQQSILGPEPMLPNQPGAQPAPPPQMMVMPDQPEQQFIQPGVNPDEEDLEPDTVNDNPRQLMLPPQMQDPRFFNNPGQQQQPLSIMQRLYQRFPQIINRVPLPKKAIVISYNRSGSNFLGELINQNNQSFYWYEPLRVNDIWDHRDPSYRSPEKDSTLVKNILDCELEKLPMEVTLDLDNVARSESAANYHKCVESVQTSDSAFKRCKDFVLAGWPQNIDIQIPGAVAEDAPEELKAFVYLFMDYSKYLSIDRNTNKVFSSIDNAITPEVGNILVSWYKNMYRMQLDQTKSRILNGHLRNFCASMLKQKSKGCMQMLQQNCTRMGLRAVKTIRFPINTLPTLLSSAPDVKVVHLIRNPRGILLSAKRQLQGAGNEEPIQWSNALTMQSTQLCKRLLMDVRARRAFETTNPDNFYQVLYEDLAMEPKHSIDILYEFFNVTAPENLYSWVDDNSEMLDTGANKETGRNSFAWKIDLNKAANTGMDSVCSTLYEELGYNSLGFRQPQMMQNNPQGMGYNQQGPYYNQPGGNINQQGFLNQQGGGFNQPNMGYNQQGMNNNPQNMQYNQQGPFMNQAPQQQPPPPPQGVPFGQNMQYNQQPQGMPMNRPGFQ